MSDTKNIRAKLEDDDAIRANVLICGLRVKGGTISEKNEQLIKLSLIALESVVNEYKSSSGKSFPSETEITNFMAKKGSTLRLDH